MDDEGKHDANLETHLQVSDAACEYAESTDSDIKQNKMYSAESADCGISVDIPIHCMDDYNVLQCATYYHKRPADVEASDVYNRHGDGIQGHIVNCFPSVKCEEHRPELNEQRHVLPVNSTDQETNWTLDVNETIQVKQEKKEYPDGYDRSSEVTKHWIVCPGGVLKEVKAEHTSDVSEILSVDSSNENVGCKIRTRTSTHLNNINDDAINDNLSTDCTCGVPSTQFTQHDNVLKVQERTTECVKRFTCDTCGRQFAYLSKLNMHEMTHMSVKPFMCDTCGRSFARSGDLKRHEITHTGVKPFTCDTCGKSFSVSGDLTVHERIHTGVKPFTCDTCGKSFSQSGHLKKHEMRHQGIKPFRCDTCGKSFTQTWELNIHEMIHTGVKPVTCDTCGKSFTHSGTLNIHKRIHTGVKPFTCDACGKLFSQSGHLKKHEMRHKGIKPFRCDTCGKSFTQPWELNRHEIRHKGIKPFRCEKSFS